MKTGIIYVMLYYVLVSIFVSAFVSANILGGHIFPFPFFEGLYLTSGTLVYPITFILSDLVTEVYGAKKAKSMVWTSLLLSVCVLLIQCLARSDFRISGILILSSLTAFLVGQLLDIQLFAQIKKWTNGKHLWMRNQFSTYLSQTVDTLIVNGLLLFWGLHLTIEAALPVFLGNFIYKMVFTLATLPLFYFSVKKVRAYET